jgi:hypothetical protein
MGDIGEGQREIEVEPLTAPSIPVPAAPTPAREPEKVPA